MPCPVEAYKVFSTQKFIVCQHIAFFDNLTAVLSPAPCSARLDRDGAFQIASHEVSGHGVGLMVIEAATVGILLLIFTSTRALINVRSKSVVACSLLVVKQPNMQKMMQQQPDLADEILIALGRSIVQASTERGVQTGRGVVWCNARQCLEDSYCTACKRRIQTQ